MINYDKIEIKNNLDIQDIFELLIEFGGEPIYQGENIIISRTICHHHPNEEASHKLYYYGENRMFYCYSGCQEPSFDIYELVRKVMSIQYHQDYDLNMAIRWIAFRFGINGSETSSKDELDDWTIFNKYNDSTELIFENGNIQLKEYDDSILDRFNYTLKLEPWLKEGINQEALNFAHIGYYPGGDQITIPHYDKDGRLVGIRGRTLCKEEAERFGKYRPLKICGTLYSHPLGMNLYNLNNSKNNIKTIHKAIVWEGEKSDLLYHSYFGAENDISVATCGSNLSSQQVRMLIEAGATEIIVSFDKQWKEKNDDEFKGWINKLKKINEKYKNEVLISFIFDKENLLGYKDSPIDRGPEIFLQLFKKRIII